MWAAYKKAEPPPQQVKPIPICVLHHIITIATTGGTAAIISNADWLTNNKRFCEAYAPTNPISVVWRKIYDALAYPDIGSTPYSMKQVMDNAYQLVFNKVFFVADFRD